MQGRGRLLLPLLALALVYLAARGRGPRGALGAGWERGPRGEFGAGQARPAGARETGATEGEEAGARSEEGSVKAEEGEETPKKKLLHGKNKKYEAGGGEGIEVNMTVR